MIIFEVITFFLLKIWTLQFCKGDISESVIERGLKLKQLLEIIRKLYDENEKHT